MRLTADQCSVSGCRKPRFSRGWCHMHWNRWRRNGDPEITRYDGHSRTPEFVVWSSMIQRCYDPTCSSYRYYGPRGIGVAEEWRRSFNAFIRAVGPRPGPQYSLDRIDNDKGYEPGNVRWATPVQQARNRRNNTRLDLNGQQVVLTEAAATAGLNLSTLAWRLRTGWPPAKALSTPADPRRPGRPAKRGLP